MIAEQTHLFLSLFSFFEQCDQFGRKGGNSGRTLKREEQMGQEKTERERERDRDESPSLLISRQG